MDSLYTRYAGALISLAMEDNDLEGYRSDIKDLRQAIKENEGILDVLSSAFIEFDEKERIIDNFYPGRVNIRNFLKIVVRNNRSRYLIKILNEFIEECNEYLNIKDGTIYSVRKLDEKEIERVEKGIEKRLSCRVELVNVIDERLIGGIKVIVDDKIFDGSIKNKVEKLKDSLVKGGA